MHINIVYILKSFSIYDVIMTTFRIWLDFHINMNGFFGFDTAYKEYDGFFFFHRFSASKVCSQVPTCSF